MDPTPYLELKPAPQIVFELAEARRQRTRFHVPDGDGWRAVTWAEYTTAIRHAALALAEDGVHAGARAAIYAPNRVEWIEAALAIQSAGGAMVPVYANSTAEQAAHVVSHSDAIVVFVDTEALLERVFTAWPAYAAVVRIVTLGAVDVEAVRSRVAASDPGVPGAEEVATRVSGFAELCRRGAAIDRAAPERFAGLLATIGLEDLAVMLYTSGTSGLPKGVPLTHANVAANGRDWLICNAPLLAEPDGEPDVDLLWLPMSHIFGFGEACLGNTLGFETWMTDPLQLMARLAEVRPTVFMSVPTVFEKIATAARAAGDAAAVRARLDALTGGRWRFCLSGGAGLKREVMELFHANGVLIIEGYGLTEAAPTLTLNRPDAFRFDTVGRPLPSVELRLADDGEIHARGPNVFAGYHKDAEATRQTFTDDGWLKTGDVGVFTEDGFLQIVDRKKDILVLASGKNVPPANIELRFADDELIAHLVVYGDGCRYLVAGVWPDPVGVAAWARRERLALDDLALDDDVALRARLYAAVAARVAAVNATLARHETIKRFEIFDEPLTVENGLITATLKVRRKHVNEAFRARFDALYVEAAAVAVTP